MINASPPNGSRARGWWSFIKNTPPLVLAFLLFGLSNNIAYVMVLSAAQMLEQNVARSLHLNESFVLMLDIVPTTVVKMLMPFLGPFIPLDVRIACSLLLQICAVAMLSFNVVTPTLPLLAVTVVSAGSGLGEVSFLELAGRHSPLAIVSWSAGTGLSGIVGSGVYLFITTALTFLPDKNLRGHLALSLCLIPDLAALWVFATHYRTTRAPSHCGGDVGLVESRASPSIYAKLKLLPYVLKTYLVPLTVLYFAEYLINQAVSPSLLFPGSAIECTEYPTYQLDYQIGSFIGRSTAMFVPYVTPYVYAALQLLNLGVLTLCVRYRIFGRAYPVVVACILAEGFFGGEGYAGTYYHLGQPETTRRQQVVGPSFSPEQLRNAITSFVLISDSLGITPASVVGIYVGRVLSPYADDLRAMNPCYGPPATRLKAE